MRVRQNRSAASARAATVEVLEDLLRRVMPRLAADFAARVLPRAAQVQPRQRGSVLRQLRQGTVPEQLLPGMLNVPDAAVRQARLALQVERRPEPAIQEGGAEVRRIFRDLVDQPL